MGEDTRDPDVLHSQVRQLTIQLAHVRAEASNARSSISGLSNRLAMRSAELEHALTALAQLAQATTEILHYGEHDGACDNEPDRLESCTLHLDAMEIREAALRAALADAADLLPGWEVPRAESRHNVPSQPLREPPKPHIASKTRPRP